ncbi:K02A2.6-like [Cordylochernes scorpioides]|uniref:RNA-directed DNA polymerase n=1 Tax=Cordylochernes scorpioides TaxID=51811 RepID=A0ABY6L669_9ARAC|nr:K02A2.6-like [Cordylochernes scorpioides]
MARELLTRGDNNVFTVDWGAGAAPPYAQATANSRMVGRVIADFITGLQANLGDIHLIGHGLGAHLAGYVGEASPGVGRITAISLYFNGKRIVIANIYIHPNSMAAFHIQFISEILEAFGQLPIILCGDFNSRHPLWFDSTTNKNGYILKSIIEEQNLFVHNLKIPTCRNSSIIDLTISNKHSIGLIHNWRTSALSVTSDHLAILFDIFNMINLANNNRQTSTWKFREKSANWTKFAESISPSDLLDLNSASKHIVNCEDIDNVVNKLTNLVIEAAYSSLDVKHHTSINTTTSKNWWNKELQQLKEHLHYLRNLYYRGGNLNPSIYRAARNKYLRAINRAKKTSWKIFIEENESTNAFGNAYRIFKRLRSADIQVGIPLLNKTAECMREQKMKEMLTAFFPDDDVRLDNEEHTLIRNHIPSFTNREIIFITEKEIKDLCSNLNIRKAPGPDNFVTGHGNFGEFLSKIGATDDPSCFCGKENQDSMHLLMMASFGNIENFDPSKPEKWTTYVERMIFFFLANGIEKITQKKAIFLTLIGPETYALVRSLAAPKDLAHVNYEEILTILTGHFCPKPNVIVQRYHFNKHNQGNEPIATYIAELRRLSENLADGLGPNILGRQWFEAFRLRINILNHIETNPFSSEFEEVFKQEIDAYNGPLIHIDIPENAEPKFVKARTVPFALRELVDKKIKSLEEQGVVEPVKFTKWASPILTVLKNDGTIRICHDYKSTVDLYSNPDKYPLPTIPQLLDRLRGGRVFTKLDMAQAYQQLKVDETSAVILAINTPRGLYKVKRLPFGLNSAVGTFQRFMDTLLSGIDGVAVYLDDVLISGRDCDDLKRKTEKVLLRFRKSGLRLKKEKCHFYVPEIEFLGMIIDHKGIHPSEEKLRAIKDARPPSNKRELMYFLGLLNYYERFLNNKATLAEPLHRLLDSNSPWKWNKEHQRSFAEVKNLISSKSVLAHFNEDLPILVNCDASEYGVGAILSQIDHGVERPVVFASRTLNKTERRYAVIDKEALAVIFGVSKFSQYLLGRKFKILTDHKPLVGIFNPKKPIPQVLSPRMLRWCLTLAAYTYSIEYKPGKVNCNADALSRLPLNEFSSVVPNPSEVFFIESEHAAINSSEVAKLTNKDPILSKVKFWAMNGWPERKVDDKYKDFVSKSSEISVHKDCLLWGSRVIIPERLRKDILNLLHDTHMGIVGTKALARGLCWWPKMDGDIERMISSCAGDMCMTEVTCFAANTSFKFLLGAVYIHPGASMQDIGILLWQGLGPYIHNSQYAPPFVQVDSSIPILLCGDFNKNVKPDNSFLKFMKNTYNLDCVSNVSKSTTLKGTTIDLTFARHITAETLPFISYFSYHRPILNKITQIGIS